MSEPLGEQSAARRLVFALKAHHEALPPAVQAELRRVEEELGTLRERDEDGADSPFTPPAAWMESALGRAQASVAMAAARAVREAFFLETKSLCDHIDTLESIIAEFQGEKQQMASVQDYSRALEEQLREARRGKNDAYSQRNKLVSAFARMALKLGWKAGVGKHKDQPGEKWEDDWRTIVFIDTPAGQVSWHFHDSEAWMLEGLPKYRGSWDGHTDREKWERLATGTRA